MGPKGEPDTKTNVLYAWTASTRCFCLFFFDFCRKMFEQCLKLGYYHFVSYLFEIVIHLFLPFGTV
jgi:hypothetical protein